MSWSAHLTSWSLVLLVTLAMVSGKHPKHKNLAGDIQNLDLGPKGGGNQFYRIRRQQPRPGHQIHSIRNIRPALEEMSRNIRSIENKLMRHEYREAQVADFAVKTLNSLTADHTLSKDSITDMARQLAAVEQKVMAVLTLVATSDERQRGMIAKVGEGLDRLLLVSSEPSLGRSPNALPELPPSPAMERDVKKILRKMAELEGNHDTRIRGVSSEVHQLSESMGQQMELVTTGQDHVLSAIRTCAEAAEATPTETVDSASCQRLESEMSTRLEMLLGLQQSQSLVMQELKETTATAMGQQEAGLYGLLRAVRQEGSHLNGSFASVLDGLQELGESSRQNLGNLHANLKSAVETNSARLQQKIEGMESSLKEEQSSILGTLEESASMTDNLQSTVNDNYNELSKEISGLNKIEQVMINTADAVLDTKRSIEFGIQQIILELSEIVSKSGSTINSTLSDQINAISFNILKNQTSALTNMTQKMEGEISQVWRQIGIMYQQVEQSINMLDNLQDTTDQHMSVSLSRVGNMDGTVGEINGKVADVENNLNYLLGRLSLVLSEFNHMKAGVGNELDRLREMAQEIYIPNGDPEDLEYTINKKRQAIPDGY